MFLTLTDLLNEYYDATKDDSAENQQRGIRRLNKAHDVICASQNWNWLEQSFTLTTTASQQSYTLPVNMRKAKDVTIVANGVRYTPQEIEDPTAWDRLNSVSITSTSDATQYVHYRAGEIRLWPIPATSSNTMTFLGLRQPTRTLTLTDYNIGTVSVTNNSATVTGSSTNWTSTTVKPGAYLVIDGKGYEILTLNSTTSITLTQAYQGATSSGIKYKIGDAPLIPEPYHDLVWLRAARDYFRNREDSAQKKSVFEDYAELFENMENSTFAKTTSRVITRGFYRPVNVNDYPTNIGF